MIKYIYFFLCVFLALSSCEENERSVAVGYEDAKAMFVSGEQELVVGAEQLPDYFPLIKDKAIGMVVNQTSRVGGRHVVDSLKELNVDIKAIFAPEHGFRGNEDAGALVDSGRDAATGIEIRSIYGKNRKPAPEQLADIDIMIFDIQDVGARFYTYISTMHYIMEACAENNIPLLVLDRPNPNGHYVDGPILDPAYRSFVGMHEIPVVHGMTVGEYAKMINGEGWLEGGMKCELKVIPCRNYKRTDLYDLPVKPSPNLPNLRSILLYPSICFIEGTNVSLGRGTDKQFQVLGHPSFEDFSFTFTPGPKPGAMSPKLNGEKCYGRDLTALSVDYLKGEARINLDYLLDSYEAYPDKEDFFLKNNFIDKLAGSDQLRKQVLAGLSAEEIRASWEDGLDNFKKVREQYLVYD